MVSKGSVSEPLKKISKKKKISESSSEDCLQPIWSYTLLKIKHQTVTNLLMWSYWFGLTWTLRRQIGRSESQLLHWHRWITTGPVKKIKWIIHETKHWEKKIHTNRLITGYKGKESAHVLECMEEGEQVKWTQVRLIWAGQKIRECLLSALVFRAEKKNMLYSWG